MAKKRVKYSFGNSASYAALAKKDQYTVYFVYDTEKDDNGKDVPSKYGTIYKGDTRIGSAKASDIVFDTELTVTVLQGATPEESVFYVIEPGTSLTDFVDGLIKQVGNWDETLRSELIGDGVNPGYILSTIEDQSRFAANGDAEGIISQAINTAIYDSVNNDNGTIHTWVNSNFISNDKLGQIQELAGILDDETVELLVNAATDIQNVLVNYYTKEEADQLLRDVIVSDSSADFPEVGDPSKLYVEADTNILYRWGISEFSETEEEEYVEISGGQGGGSSSSIRVETHLYFKDGITSTSIAKGDSYTVKYAFSSGYVIPIYSHGKVFEKTQQFGSEADVKYYLDGVQIGSGRCRQADYVEDDSKNVYNTFEIPASKLANGSEHRFMVIVTDRNGNSNVTDINNNTETNNATITINIVNVSITSSFDGNPQPLTSPISINTSVFSSNSVDIYYKVNDDDEVLASTVSSGSGNAIINISNYENSDSTGNLRAHGVYNIRIWATTFIEDANSYIKTKELEYNVIWYDPANRVPVISFVCKNDPVDGVYNATQYDYTTFTYQVYPKSDINLIAHNLSSGEEPKIIKSLTNIDTALHSWSYIFNDYGTYELYAQALYNNGEDYVESTKFTINVNKSDYDMSPVDGAIFYMTAINHDNSGSHDWVPEIIPEEYVENHTDKAILTGFAWNDISGWKQNEQVTSLHVAGGAHCSIPFKPFKTNYAAPGRSIASTGMTLEFDFSTSNLSDSQTTVISCYSGGNEKKGITITATGAYWETQQYSRTDSNDTRIFVPFKEEERIRISFVMTSNITDDIGSTTHPVDIYNVTTKLYDKNVDSVAKGWWKFLKIYINGICVHISNYDGDGGITQANNYSTIEIGSDNADVDIYGIRMYDRFLTDYEIVKNYIADTQDPVEKLNIFLRNQILNNSNSNLIDPVKLSTKIPCMYVTCESTSTYGGFTNNNNTLPISKKDKTGFTIIYNCDFLDDDIKERYPFAKSFIAYNAQMTVQGTSSQYYPRKNYKLKFKGAKTWPGVAGYEKQIGSSSKKPTFLFVDNINNINVEYDEERWPNTADYIKYCCTLDTHGNAYQKDYKLREYGNDIIDSEDVERITSIPAENFCLKADFMESSSTHNTGLARYVDFLYKRLGENYLTPPQRAQYIASQKSGFNKMFDVNLRTSVDGYPIAMFWRKTFRDDYEFLGKYNFNIDKAAENTFGFIDSIEDLINPTTGYNFLSFNEDYYDESLTSDKQDYESPVECWEFTNNTTNLCKFRYVTDTTFTEPSSEAGKENTAAWMESFEIRHPDDDYLIDDYTNRVVVPKHWSDFCKWVSSTNRSGYHNEENKTLPIARAWNGTFNDLVNGVGNNTSYISINNYLTEINKDPKNQQWYQEVNGECLPGILEPQVIVDESNNEYGADVAYAYYGYIVTFDPTVENTETNEPGAWVLGELYVRETAAVNTAYHYYINKEGDPNNGKVYEYSKANKQWEEIANISEYALDTPVVINNTRYEYDTAEYRLAKFTKELPEHMNLNVTTVYYIISEFFACVDQRAKNMMFASWGYEPGIDKVKAPDAFASEEEAASATVPYKPVYKYTIDTVSSAETPSRFISASGDLVFGAGNNHTVVINDTAATNVCFNEIDANGLDTNVGKYIELYNPTETPINLNGWILKKGDTLAYSLTDDTQGINIKDVENDKSVTFNNEASIAAGGYLKVPCIKKSTTPNVLPSGISADGGFALRLYDNSGSGIPVAELDNGKYNSDGTARENVEFRAAVAGEYCVIARETPGGANWVKSTTSTPGSVNIITDPGQQVEPEEPEEPGITVTQLTSFESFNSQISELSGICYNSDKTYLYGVSDHIKGKNDEGSILDNKVFKINVETGEVEAVTISGLDDSDNLDFEAITSYNGHIYILAESDTDRQGAIYELNESTGAITKITTSLGLAPVSGQGFEGIAAYDVNKFYIGNQSEPIALYKYENSSLTQIAELDNTTEIGDLSFAGGNIWVLDSQQFTVSKYNTSGEFIEQYSLSFLNNHPKSKPNPEALLVDVENDIMWVACDISSPGENDPILYKVSLSNTPMGTKTVVINELDPNEKIWELYNTTDSPITLGDGTDGNSYYMTKSSWDATNQKLSENTDEKFVFGKTQATQVIPAHGYLVISQVNDPNDPGFNVTGPQFGLSGANKGFYYTLYNSHGTPVDVVDNLGRPTDATVIGKNQTYGRIVDGGDEFTLFKNGGSIGSSNSNGIINESTLYITEVDPNAETFTIYNSGNEAIDTSGLVITKSDGRPAKDKTFTITPATACCSSTVIPSKSEMIFRCDKNSDNIQYPKFGLSDDKGFILFITKTDNNVTTLLDKVSYINERCINTAFIPITSSESNEYVTFGRKVEDNNFYLYTYEYDPSTNIVGERIKESLITELVRQRDLSIFEDEDNDKYGKIIINEICPSTDQIELYNTSNEEINLYGYTITKNNDYRHCWSFPANSTISGGQYLLVNCNKFNAAEGPEFGISGKDGFYLTLSQSAALTRVNTETGEIDNTNVSKEFDNGAIVDTNKLIIDDIVIYSVEDENFVEIPSGYSIGRIHGNLSEWSLYSTPSMGQPNSMGEIYVPEEINVDPGQIITDHLVINEVCGGDGNKLIEIYNPTNNTITLGGNYALVKYDSDGYFETDPTDPTSHDYWIYPSGAVIQPHGYYISAAGGLTVPNKYAQGGIVGATFGLSLRSGKQFILRLFKVNSSTDYSTLEAIFSSAQLVDTLDRMTDPNVPTVAEKGSLETYGRIVDGAENWALFASSSTKIGTLGESNANGTIIATGGQTTPDVTTHKEVAYWVPADCHYIYYPIFYDNDSIMGVNNTGYLHYQPNCESTDTWGSGFVFNGAESTLWLNFADAFAAKIASTYETMRSSGGLNLDKAKYYFNETQSDAWSEIVYNMDAKFKYVDPATIGYTDFGIEDEDPTTPYGGYGVNIQNAHYLYTCQGSRSSHRSWWLNSRFNYMDSRYNTGTYKTGTATMRLYTPVYVDPRDTEHATINTPKVNASIEAYPPTAPLTITPYTDMYLRVRFGSRDGVVRAQRNKECKITSGTDDAYNNTETIIYGAPYILSLGDMSDKYSDSVDIANASRIVEYVAGHDAPYCNLNMKDLTFGPNNTALKKVDVTNCTNLSSLVNINAVPGLEEFHARGTALGSIDFPTGGCNLKKVDYPATISSIKLYKMPYLMYMNDVTKKNITFETLKNVSAVDIRECPLIDTWYLVQSILLTPGNSLMNVRVDNLNANIGVNLGEFDVWTKLITLNGINENGDTNAFSGTPFIEGAVNLGPAITVSSGYKSNIEAKFAKIGAELTVNTDNANVIDINKVIINGPTQIAPNHWYTYTISYGPDDYIEQPQRGVTWEVDSNFDIDQSTLTDESITISYNNSTSGSFHGPLKAISKYNTDCSALIDITPSATLSDIYFTTFEGERISTVDINEGDTFTFYINYLPQGTQDTLVNISIVNERFLQTIGNAKYEYSPNSNSITITAGEVSSTEYVIIQVTSQSLESVSCTLRINIKNVVSRIVYLQDASKNGISGYVKIYTSDSTGPEDYYRISTSSSNPGVVTIPTVGEIPVQYSLDSERTSWEFGHGQLIVEPHATDEATKFYNKPDNITFRALSVTATSDVESFVEFYEPVNASILIYNGGKVVTDTYLKITSAQNATIRTLTSGNYNNVVYYNAINNSNPAVIKLLANTSHDITIVECDQHGNEIVGGKYSKYSGVINTTTVDGSYSIQISRDYLGTISTYSEDTLKMTVLTGNSTAYQTLRLYCIIHGDITINWGDGNTETLYYNNNDNERAIFHLYADPDAEYDITITNDTQNIEWFNISSKESNSAMVPCFGSGNSLENFSKTFNLNCGGLVAYQSIGKANITTPMKFGMTQSNKIYCHLISIGDIYKKCVDITDANSFFANTTLEQIPSSPLLFRNCVNIEKFDKTFENTNITELPPNFFENNTKATSFIDTFNNCKQLSNINTDKNTQMFYLDDNLEMKSVKGMFAGCSELKSEVPELWKTFHACSFCDTFINNGLAQKTFENCTQTLNYLSIPASWGGLSSTAEYVSAINIVPLRYINLGRSALSYFEIPLSHIACDLNWSYEFKFTVPDSTAWHEPAPLFGWAYGNDLSDENSITAENGYLADFYYLGAIGEDNTKINLNLMQNHDFIYHYGSREIKMINDLFTNLQKNSDYIIKIIPTTGQTQLYLNDTKETSIKKNEHTFVYQPTPSTVTIANFPLRILYAYGLDRDNSFAYNDNPYQDKPNQSMGYHTNNRPYQAQWHSFKGLKIYNESGALIHDIIPVYSYSHNIGRPGLYDKLDPSYVCFASENYNTDISLAADMHVSYYRDYNTII